MKILFWILYFCIPTIYILLCEYYMKYQHIKKYGDLEYYTTCDETFWIVTYDDDPWYVGIATIFWPIILVITIFYFVVIKNIIKLRKKLNDHFIQ